MHCLRLLKGSLFRLVLFNTLNEKDNKDRRRARREIVCLPNLEIDCKFVISFTACWRGPGETETPAKICRTKFHTKLPRERRVKRAWRGFPRSRVSAWITGLCIFTHSCTHTNRQAGICELRSNGQGAITRRSSHTRRGFCLLNRTRRTVCGSSVSVEIKGFKIKHWGAFNMLLLFTHSDKSSIAQEERLIDDKDPPILVRLHVH